MANAHTLPLEDGNSGMPLRSRKAYPRWTKMGLAAICLVAVLAYICRTVRFDDAWLYWLEVFTSNWSPEKREAVGNTWFNVGIIVALIINYAPFVGIIAALWKLTVGERKTVVKLSQAFALRDALVRDQLYSKLTLEQARNLKPLIDAAFLEGTEIWRKNDLVKVFGEADAKRLLRIVDKADSETIELN